MDEEQLALLVDLHVRQERQGPGGAEQTDLAIELARLDKTKRLRIADVGCGTGASTLQLAERLNADIKAVDMLPEFIDALKNRADAQGLREKIRTFTCTMDALPFADEEFDVIWSEGAIYNIGFANGAKSWNRFLKPGGVLVVSEITWLTGERPSEINEYWSMVYPEIATASSKLAVLEQCGYAPIGYFVLPERCWLGNYYRPLQRQFPDFLARHPGNEQAASIVENEESEIALYEKHKRFYSYGMYIARKVAAQ